MAYNQNIPQPPDRFYISQGDILQNFQETYTVTQKNHTVLNDADQGKHSVVQLINDDINPTIPNATPLANIPLISNFPDYVNSKFVPLEDNNCSFAIAEKIASGFADTDPFRINIDQNPVNTFFYSVSYKLPSGLLVKQFRINGFSIDNDAIFTPKFYVNLKLNEIGIPFNTVYWATVDLGASSTSRDDNFWPYVVSLSATTCSIGLWFRDFEGYPSSYTITTFPILRVTVFGRGDQ